MKYARICEAVYNTPWMVLPEKLATIEAYVRARVLGKASESPAVAARDRSTHQRRGVAIVGMYGTILPRTYMLNPFSGGVSLEQFRQDMRALVDDERISAIVLDIDSPGGMVAGVRETWDLLMEARERKQIVAVANTLMASAAYYLGSAAGRVVATPSADVGSIGVVMAHYDYSRQLDREGITPTVLRSGKYKAEGLPVEPLSQEAREWAQAQLDRLHDEFVRSVAAGRAVSLTQVREHFGQGRVVDAQSALKAGMVDEVATLESVVERLQAGRTIKSWRARLEALRPPRIT